MTFAGALAAPPLLQVLAFGPSLQAGRDWIQSVVRADVSSGALDAFDSRLGEQGLRETPFGDFFLDFGRRRLRQEAANPQELAALANLYDGLSSHERLGFQIAALTATVRSSARFAQGGPPQILGIGPNQNFKKLLEGFDVTTLPWNELQDILRAAYYSDQPIALPPPLTWPGRMWKGFFLEWGRFVEAKMMKVPSEDRGEIVRETARAFARCEVARQAARIFARGGNFREAGYVLQRAGGYLAALDLLSEAGELFIEGAHYYRKGSLSASAGYLFALGKDFSDAALEVQKVADHPADQVTVPFSAVLTLAKRALEKKTGENSDSEDAAGSLPVLAALQRAYGLVLRDQELFLLSILHLLDAATNALAGGDAEAAHRAFHSASEVYSPLNPHAD